MIRSASRIANVEKNSSAAPVPATVQKACEFHGHQTLPQGSNPALGKQWSRDYPDEVSAPSTLPDANLHYQEAFDWRTMDKRRRGFDRAVMVAVPWHARAGGPEETENVCHGMPMVLDNSCRARRDHRIAGACDSCVCFQFRSRCQCNTVAQ